MRLEPSSAALFPQTFSRSSTYVILYLRWQGRHRLREFRLTRLSMEREDMVTEMEQALMGKVRLSLNISSEIDNLTLTRLGDYVVLFCSYYAGSAKTSQLGILMK
jgi:hypothetical protein